MNLDTLETATKNAKRDKRKHSRENKHEDSHVHNEWPASSEHLRERDVT